MNLPLRRLGAALLLCVLAVTATACTAPPTGSTPSANPTSPAPAATSPSPTPEPEETPEPLAEPTCETIIAKAIVDDFASVGWTVLADAFHLGEAELAGGVQCMWGDFTTVSDHVQRFGWAPITAEEAQTAQELLLEEGWIREDAPDGVYITESPNTSIATDEDGYGTTYFFGDGYVMMSDTKQGLLLIEWPPA